MELTEKEQKLINEYTNNHLYGLGMDDVEVTSSLINDNMVSIYFTNSYTEELDIVCNLTKKIIIDNLKLNGIDINNYTKFNIDEILNSILSSNEEIFDRKLELPNFDINYLKNYEQLKSYIEKLLENKNADEIKNIDTELSFIDFRGYMSNFIPKIANSIELLYRNLLDEHAVIDLDNFSTSDDYIDLFDGPSTSDNNDEFDWENDLVSDHQFNDEIKEDDFDTDFNDFDVKEEDSQFNFNFDNYDDILKEIPSNNELIEFVQFLNTVPELIECKSNLWDIHDFIKKKWEESILNEFYSNEEFMDDFKKLMAHNIKEHRYWFHGTQCLEDAYSIIEQGLGLSRDDISSTAYQEFSIEDCILYSRGFMGEIGRDALVVIDMPIIDNQKENIIKENTSEINFCPSGLQGLDNKANYIIDTKYIIGIIDKKDKKIMFNPNYYLADQYIEENGMKR